MSLQPGPGEDIKDARVLAVLGDSVTADHISPAGSIKKDSPAGKYLIDHGVKPVDFNSYGSRRGNHEVMVRGTFANVRLRNKMVPNLEGGFTKHLPDGAEMTIFEASEKYVAQGVPLVILAGKEYGSGSSRDWAAKGPLLLGVHAVIAESYERIHRSNLVGMAGDGQVTLGEGVIKHTAKKIRRLYQDKILAGFAGSTADAFSLFSRFEAKLEQYHGNIGRGAVELAKDWRTDKFLRHLEALLLVSDKDQTFLLSGQCDVIEPDGRIAPIGSGGPYAQAAAQALSEQTQLSARQIAEEAMKIAGKMCIYTNDKVTIEEL